MVKKIIIVGGGFAGLNLAKHLSNNQRFEVTVVDKNNYHFFPPLLYQVSTAFIEPSNISYPFRKMFQRHGFHWQWGLQNDGADPAIGHRSGQKSIITVTK
jgi:NADH dehydrogenase